MADDGFAALLTVTNAMYFDINSCRIELVYGDITDQEIDAIVNAANASLAGGGGVDGAIHRRGGAAIMKETNEKYPAGCPTGSAVVSGAGNLKAKFIFHAVGPRWKGGTANEQELLQSAYRTCLELAVKYNCQSIAFPSISTGIYGYPIQQAAPLAIETVIKFIRETPKALRLVRFCLFSDADLEVYSKALETAERPVGRTRKMA
jgi:O-acetyl-ADP-ribose deacetylase (regulator of RNase III)